MAEIPKYIVNRHAKVLGLVEVWCAGSETSARSSIFRSTRLSVPVDLKSHAGSISPDLNEEDKKVLKRLIAVLEKDDQALNLLQR